MRVDRSMQPVRYPAHPFRQQPIERHGHHHAGHADIAVVDDLEGVEDVTEGR